MWLGPLPPGVVEGVALVLDPADGHLELELRDRLDRPWTWREGVGWAAPLPPPEPLPELVQPQDLGGPTPAERAQQAAAAAGADWDGQALSAVTGPTGARVRVLVGEDGRPEGLLWADGELLRWTWGAEGVERFDGRRGRQGRVVRGDGLKFVDPVHGERSVSFPTARPGAEPGAPAEAGWVTVRDGAGREVRARRDGVGRWVELGDPRGLSLSLVHDEAQLSLTTAGGAVWRVAVDSAGRPTRLTTPAGRIWGVERDADGRVIERIDPAGVRTRYERDAAGRVVAVSHAGERTTLERDAAGRLRLITGPQGHQSRITRDEAGRPVSITDPSGAIIGLEWDQEGRLLGLSAPDGGSWGLGRDPRGRLDALLYPSGAQLRFDRAGDGLVEQVVREGWGSLRVRRGADGRASGLEDGEGRRTGLSRDPSGALRRVRRPDGSDLLLERDPLGELVAVVGDHGVVRVPRDGQGRPLAAGPVRWQWDSDGALTALRAGAVHVELARDAAGRLRGVRSGGWSAEVSRDARGLPVRWRSPEGELEVRRDPRGHIISERGLLGEVQIVRDVRGLVSRVVSALGTWVWSRDSHGRPLRVQIGEHTVGWDWSLDGRLALERLPGGALHTWTWDWNTVQDVVLDAAGLPVRQRTVALDAEGRVRWLQQGDGAKEVWRTDPLGALVAIERGDEALWSSTPASWAGPDGLLVIRDQRGRPAEVHGSGRLPLFAITEQLAILERDELGRLVGVRGEQGGARLRWGGPGWLEAVEVEGGAWELRRDPRGRPVEVSGPDGPTPLLWLDHDEGPGGGGLLTSGATMTRRWAPGPAGPTLWVDEVGAGAVTRSVGGGGLFFDGRGAPVVVDEGPVGGPDSGALGPAAAPLTLRLFPGGPLVAAHGAWEPVTGARIDGLSPPPWSTDRGHSWTEAPLDPAPWAPTSPWADPLRLVEALGVLPAEPDEGAWVPLLRPAPAFAWLPPGVDGLAAPLGPAVASLPLDEHPVVVALLAMQLQGRAALDVETLLLNAIEEEVSPDGWHRPLLPGLFTPGQGLLRPPAFGWGAPQR
jgi:YD repeat-containing protein